MNVSTSTLSQRLAVCSWSLQPDNIQDLIAKLQQTGVNRVQLALDPLHQNPAAWIKTGEQLQQAGITIVSGMFGCVGEDYSTLESIKLTGGVVPDATWAQTWKSITNAASFARRLNLRLATFHAGFLPHEESDPNFARLKERLVQVAELFRASNVTVGLETGQESADVLFNFMQKLARPNVVVNFDPANMLLYDKGDPVAALRKLGRWVRQVHIKDARRTKTPGTWGDEVVAGTGEVDWPAFFAALQEVGFKGDLCIEREAGAQRVADIRTAREMVERLAP